MNEIICRLQTAFTISISIMHLECGSCLLSSFSYILENAEFYTMDYVLEVDDSTGIFLLLRISVSYSAPTGLHRRTAY